MRGPAPVLDLVFRRRGFHSTSAAFAPADDDGASGSDTDTVAGTADDPSRYLPSMKGLPLPFSEISRGVQREGEDRETYLARRRAELDEAGFIPVKSLKKVTEAYTFVSPDSEEEEEEAKTATRRAADVHALLEDGKIETREQLRAAIEAERASFEEAHTDWELDSESEWGMEDVRIRESPLWMTFEREREAELQKLELPDDTPPFWANKAQIKVPMRDEKGRAYATGRRKTAAARVWITEGDGKFTVNRQKLHHYFERASLRRECLAPFIATRSCGAFDVWLTVKGGGKAGQAGAVKHGVARALSNYDPFLRPVLKKLKLLKRDPRMVERKKPGQKKARKKFQWVKR